jgi:hypothetical protein
LCTTTETHTGRVIRPDRHRPQWPLAPALPLPLAPTAPAVPVEPAVEPFDIAPEFAPRFEAVEVEDGLLFEPAVVL